MKLLTLTLILGLTYTNVVAQTISSDSLHTLEKQLAASAPDTNRVILLRTICTAYLVSNPELGRKYIEDGLALSLKLNYRKGEADCLRWFGNILKRQGQYPQALDNFQKALEISYEIHDVRGISAGLGHIGDIYAEDKDYTKARNNFFRGKKIDEESENYSELSLMLIRIGNSYREEESMDSAMFYYDQADKLTSSQKFKFAADFLFSSIGQLYLNKGDNAKAMSYFRKSIPFSTSHNAQGNLSTAYLGIATIFQKSGQHDSSISYGKQALFFAQQVNFVKGIMAASQLLSEEYDKVDKAEAYKYYKIAVAARDSMFNAEKVRQIQNLVFTDQQRLRAIEDAKAESANKLRLYSLLFVLAVFLFLAAFFYINYRNKQKANKILQEQKEEIQRTLTELKRTQEQLVHSEKMASLGELTAGIAHEIQNPLNFVNNFSEVNTELIDEMQRELRLLGNHDVLAISNDIKSNLEKINQHGKRADAIIKSMLEHSRISSGKKESVDFNNLVDEYIRLAQLGLKGKDPRDSANKSLDVNVQTTYDASVGMINIIPQDFGRVILNLISNAFYAVVEKSKKSLQGYEPMVSVTTKKRNAHIEIKIKDNGIGISQKTLKKIFQPFFTTKPTGQGTGLGLSLAYDIIKSHGGDIKVETSEMEFTEFTIDFPDARS